MSAAPDGEAFPTDLESVRKGDLESPTPSNGTQQKEPRMDNVYVLHETGELPLFWAELWQKKHGLNPIECKKEESAFWRKELARRGRWRTVLAYCAILIFIALNLSIVSIFASAIIGIIGFAVFVWFWFYSYDRTFDVKKEQAVLNYQHDIEKLNFAVWMSSPIAESPLERCPTAIKAREIVDEILVGWAYHKIMCEEKRIHGDVVHCKSRMKEIFGSANTFGLTDENHTRYYKTAEQKMWFYEI